MYVTLEELSKYLESLVAGNYHGKINIGLYDGKFTSIKLDASIDLKAIKKLGEENIDE